MENLSESGLPTKGERGRFAAHPDMTASFLSTLRSVLCLLLAVAGFLPAADAGGEHIVVSGGPALRHWEEYRIPSDQHDRYGGNFIKAAHIRMQGLRRSHPGAALTWMIYRPAYEARDREDAVRRPPYVCDMREIQDRAAHVGARIVWFSSTPQLISYLNNRRGRLIDSFEYFGHSNKYAFLFDYSCDILGVSTCYLHAKDLRSIRGGAFSRGAHIQSWGCHTAEYMSQVFRRRTGRPMIGAVGKTDYSAISDNVSLPAVNGRWGQ